MINHPSAGLYPVLLRIVGRVCLMVGGGKVAVRKTEGLLSAGGLVTVMSPVLHPTLESLANTGKISVLRQTYQPGLMANLRPLLVFAATDNAVVNAQVVAEAHSLNLLADSVEIGGERDFISMAVIRRGLITIAVTTEGASPALTAHIKTEIEKIIGEEYGLLADWLHELRPQIEALLPESAQRADLWQALVASPALDLLRAGDTNGARQILITLMKQRVEKQQSNG